MDGQKTYKRNLYLSKDLEILHHAQEKQLEDVPLWKKQLYQRKLSREEEEEESRRVEKERTTENVERTNENKELHWREELINRKKERLLNNNDPVYMRKMQIEFLQNELRSKDHPDWKVQLIHRKIEKINKEIRELLNSS